MIKLGTNKHKSESADSCTVNDRDYSSLYQSADKASIQMQRRYFQFHDWQLAVLLIGSGASAFAQIIPERLSSRFYVGMAILLVFGVLLSVLSRMWKYDEKWFNCRAVAESTKSATWRFMMKACPFENDDTAKEIFRLKVREIQSRSQASLHVLAPYQAPDAKLISQFMINMRSKSVKERKSQYLESRLSALKTWYIEKAAHNSVRETRWFFLTTACQFLAIIVAIIQLGFSLAVNLVPIFMTGAAAAIAWNQMRRHRELAQSYTLVSKELEELESMATDQTSEADFRAFVNDVEFAISREHTMWCVRRK